MTSKDLENIDNVIVKTEITSSQNATGIDTNALTPLSSNLALSNENVNESIPAVQDNLPNKEVTSSQSEDLNEVFIYIIINDVTSLHNNAKFNALKDNTMNSIYNQTISDYITSNVLFRVFFVITKTEVSIKKTLTRTVVIVETRNEQNFYEEIQETIKTHLVHVETIKKSLECLLIKK